ncbi:MAG: chemotaxis protein CheX [Deltaproteobacteria bacterium]|nr:chemotaxis protein CheX [Deltaproteobacteria bacterium]
MRAEHINAFLVPSVEVLRRMARTDVRVGRLTRFESSLPEHDWSIIIGLSGGISGSVVLSFCPEVARTLAGRIAREEPDEAATGEIMGILSELANTIVGNATGHLSELGIREGITPPTVVRGSQVRFDFADSTESIRVPLKTGAGALDMIVSLAKDKS